MTLAHTARPVAAGQPQSQTGTYIASQEAKWDAIVKAANIKLK